MKGLRAGAIVIVVALLWAWHAGQGRRRAAVEKPDPDRSVIDVMGDVKAGHAIPTKRAADGTLLYFDGRQWTDRPPPAQDSPLRLDRQDRPFNSP